MKKLLSFSILAVLMLALSVTGSSVTDCEHIFTCYTSDNNATYSADGTKTALCDNGCGETDTLADKGSQLKLGVTDSISFTSKSNSVTLKWSAVKDAKGYRVFVKNKQSGKWEIAVRTTGRKTETTVEGLEQGTKYTFAVRAYRNDGKIIWAPKYKSVAAVTKPGVTDEVLSDSERSAVELSWSKVQGATGYRIYVRRDGKWKALKTTTSTAYTVPSLKAGQEYTFAVKAYTKYGGNYYWAENYARYSTVTLPGVTSSISEMNITSDTVSLGWDKVDGATGYRVYRRNSVTGKWETEIRATAKTYTTVKDLSPEESYTFAVRAYKKYNGSYFWSDSYKKLTVTTEKENEFIRVNHLQIHESWSDKIYGKMTFADSGCGIMSIVNAVYNLNGTFIHPHEIADWAYENKLYNRYGDGGSALNVVSKVCGEFGEKYGFRLIKTYTDYGTLKSSKTAREAMINHLQSGGTVVAHVYQHYFIIVDYDAEKGKFLVFDSFPGSYYGEDTGSRRYGYTTEGGDWKTAAELSVYPLDLDRFYLIGEY